MKVSDVVKYLDSLSIDYCIDGNEDIVLLGYSSLFRYQAGTITWLRDYSTLLSGDFSIPKRFACIVTSKGTERLYNAECQIWVDNPKDAFFDILDQFWTEVEDLKISSNANIKNGAKLGDNVSIGPFTSISSKTIIGNNCKIGSNVVIKGKVTIGDNCVVQSGAVLGEDGFGFIKKENSQKFVKHYGGVTLENNVQVGAQTCICRGAIDDTYIGEHTKIDNLCHIAHNVVIGKRCLVIAGTVIMGSVHIGNDCWIATSIIRDLRKIGNNCVIGMGAVVVENVPDGTTVVGNPAKEYVK